MTWTRWIWPTAIMFSTLAVCVFVYGDFVVLPRQAAALWFLLICPGMAFVRLLRLQDVWAEIALAVGLSLALEVFVALMLVYGGWWSPPAGLAILVVATVIGVAAQVHQLTRPLPVMAEPAGDVP